MMHAKLIREEGQDVAILHTERNGKYRVQLCPFASPNPDGSQIGCGDWCQFLEVDTEPGCGEVIPVVKISCAGTQLVHVLKDELEQMRKERKENRNKDFVRL